MLGQFANLRGGLARKRGRGVFRGIHTSMHTMYLRDLERSIRIQEYQSKELRQIRYIHYAKWAVALCRKNIDLKEVGNPIYTFSKVVLISYKQRLQLHEILVIAHLPHRENVSNNYTPTLIVCLKRKITFHF